MEVKAYEGDGLSFIYSFAAADRECEIDGKDHPAINAVQGSAISTRQVDEHSLIITHKYSGKVTGTEDVELSADLKTLTMTLHFAGSDKPDVMVHQRR